MPETLVAEQTEILVVEDELSQRIALAHLLKGRGYKVLLAESGPNAVIRAAEGRVTVVLMDIALGGEMDGIEAAEEIQRLCSLTSFIFVSAFAHQTSYVERIRASRVRVGGMLEKPVDVDHLHALIHKEVLKLQILESLEVVRSGGSDPFEYLRTYEGSVPQEVFDEVLAELRSSELLMPLESVSREEEEEPDMDKIAAQIEEVFDQMETLVVQKADDPDLGEALRPLRERLWELQETEANAIEKHYLAQLLFDPEESQQLITQAKNILKKT